MNTTNDFALLLLESPWWTPRDNPTRASSLPFFEGLRKLHDGLFNIYYSTFYDTAGFETALSQDLTKTKKERQILYIGAHGGRSSIADGRASTILEKVGENGKRIGGVIISSCCVADKDSNLFSALSYKNLRWVFGYTSTVNWLDSVLLELAIVESLIGTTNADDADTEVLLKTFASALSKFNPNASFGEKGKPLRDCIRLFQRAKGKHYSADLTDDVAARAWGKNDEE